MDRKRRLAPETWERIRKRREGGESIRTLVEDYGVLHSTIYRRSVSEGWKVPKEVFREPKQERPRIRNASSYHDTMMRYGEGRTGKNEVLSQVDGQQVLSDECKHLLASPPPLLQSIQKLIDTAASDPANFQLALARWGQELIAAGAAEIRPPSSIAEVVQLQGLIRKAANLDAKGTASPAAMFSPLRPIRGSVVESSPDDQDPDDQEPDDQEPDDQDPDDQEPDAFEV